MFADKVKEKVSRINNDLFLYESSHDNELSLNITEKLIKDINSLQNCVLEEYHRLGMLNVLWKSVQSDYSCEVKNDNGIHVIFNKLLPKRDSKMEVAACKKAMIEVFLDCQSIKYNERVVVSFIHHFANNQNQRDYDNIESKPFIDTIKMFFLKDDSPKYMSAFYDYKEDTKSYTEIVIQSEEEFKRQPS